MQANERDGIHISRQPCGPRDVKVSSTCPPELQRAGPWRVEDFDLHKRLYQGKASLLYSASCKQSQLPVAVKVYRKARLSELNWYQVEREIRIHSRLLHDNIIQLYAAFEDDSNVYMVQEYAAGGDLYESLKHSGGRFEETRAAVHVLRPCISALMYLHSRGIIHRDIKPENILLMSDHSIKLADFGLSIDATSERPVTRAGTLDYMAPEVLLCPEKSRPQENKEKVLLGYTAMVDAWAMGILAYELTVGRPPFEKQSRAATYEHIMYRKPEFPTSMSPDAKNFVFTALTKAARKRPALASMLSHRWLQPPTAPSTSTSSGASQPPAQLLVSATPLLNPPGPVLTAPSPPGLSSLGLTSTDAPGAQLVTPTGAQCVTPPPEEGRHHAEVSRGATAFEETSVSPESMAAHSESRLVFGSSTLDPPAGASGQLGSARVSTQRSFQDHSLSNPPSTSFSRQGGEESDTVQRQPTWTASLKRSMLKMISKGSSSSRDFKSTQDAAAAAVASTRVSASTNQAGAETSPGGGRATGVAGGVSLSVRGSNIRPQHATSFKASANSPTSALLGPIGSQTLSQTPLGSPVASQDVSVKSGKRAQRSSSVDTSSLDAEASHTRLPKPSLDSGPPSGQGKPWLASAASLPASGLKGTLHASKGSAARMESPHHGSGVTPPVFTLVPQPSQPVQTVQQMLAEMQSRQSAGGRQSPGDASAALGLTSMTDSVTSIGEGKARQAGSSSMASPFADSLSSAKPFANSISRRYAMGGASAGLGGGGSSSNFTDYAGAQLGPGDTLRGSVSSPLNVRNSPRMLQQLEESVDSQASEVAGAHPLSPRLERNAQLMTRSQSLALPDSAVLETSKRSASNRNSFRRADTDVSSRSQRQLSLKGVSDDSGWSTVLRGQQQQKGEKLVQKRRLTKDQNIEPPRAMWAGLSVPKDGAVGSFADSPKAGSGLIKAGLGFEEEDTRKGY